MFQLHVKLARDSFNTPWGFRLQGGKDLNQPLTIQRVFTGTPAEGELQRGDVIVSINGRDAAHFTHKQAQDLIKFGGGQIELIVNRPPPGRDTVQPLAPQSPTKAPSVVDPFKTYTPVSVPIRRSGPLSPPSRPNMPPPAHAGFKPKKVTLNKFGGGGYGFGSTYSPQTPPAQAAPAARPYHPPPPSQPQVLQQEQWEQPPQPQFEPGEKLVEEEHYGPVRDRRKMFVEREERPPQIEYDEDDYPVAPVWERKKLFSEPPRLALNRTHRPVRLSSQRSVPDSPYTSFGTPYTSSPQPYKPASPVRKPQPQPINQAPYQPQYEQEGTPAWGQTLKGQGLKPWEKEERERQEFEQKATMGYFSEPSAPVSPTPRIIQIKTQSTARPQQQQYHQPQHQRQHEAPRSVSPVVPPKPNRSPARSPARSPQPYSTSLSPSAGQSDGPSVVHLQYNTPIGLYSKENIVDTYRGQVQSREAAASPAAKPKPVAPQDRDWNQSHVYRMLHEEKTTTQQQMYPGQSPQTQTTTRTRETYETKHPGQEPKRTVKETFATSGGPPKGGSQLTFEDESIGISDF